MVAPLTLLFDVTATVGYFLLLPGLLAVLYLVAWKEIRGGERFGISRDTFWVLVLGGGVGTLGNLPVFYWGGSVMAVNVGGALIPVALSLIILLRFVRPISPSTLLGTVALWAGASFVAVFLFIRGAPWYAGLLAIVAGMAFVPLWPGARASPLSALRRAIDVYAILAATTISTFLTTYVVLSVGIVSPFPFLLLPPLIGAALSVIALRGHPSAAGLAYATSTLGGLMGADVLHQPGLYVPTAGAFLGAIGGAGLEDLVYLTGLLSLSMALLILLPFRGARPEVAPEPVTPTRPGMRAALTFYRHRQYDRVPPAVMEGLRAEAQETRRVLEYGDAPRLVLGPTTFAGFRFNPLVMADEERLAYMARQATSDRTTAWRALATGYFLERALAEAARFRLAGPIERGRAFLIDVAVTLGPAALLLLALYHWWQIPDWTTALYASPPYEAALFGAAGYPMLFFAISEWLFATTPGKWWVGLEVRGRALERPGLLEALGRNIPKLLPTTSLAFAIGLAIPFGLAGGLEAWSLAIAFVLGGIGSVLMLGWIGAITMTANPRRRRLGDLMVGTQVLRVTPRSPWAVRAARRVSAPSATA